MYTGLEHTQKQFTSLTVRLIKKLIKNVSTTDKTACV